jgi:hypothetical protein
MESAATSTSTASEAEPHSDDGSPGEDQRDGAGQAPLPADAAAYFLSALLAPGGSLLQLAWVGEVVSHPRKRSS